MATATKSASSVHAGQRRAWLPLVTLPAAVMLLASHRPAWIYMWMLAVSIYTGFKWLTYTDSAAARGAPAWRVIGYWLLWPGMNATAFFNRNKTVPRPAKGEWWWAIGKFVLGVLLTRVAVQSVDVWHPLVVGWLGMTGIVVALHFGVFHLLSLGWRSAGVDAPPLMVAPLYCVSVSDFWGHRWNRAFRDLGHAYIFRPLRRPLGGELAMLGVFLFSGMVHDLVISLPARGGWGLPTSYFTVQGIACWVERSGIGKQWQLRRSLRGRLFAAAVILLPVPLVFHAVFVERVVVPMLRAWGAIG